jgi:hypothetical protein
MSGPARGRREAFSGRKESPPRMAAAPGPAPGLEPLVGNGLAVPPGGPIPAACTLLPGSRDAGTRAGAAEEETCRCAGL